MTSTIDTAANRNNLDRLSAIWRDLLAQALARGFHGTAALEITVQDGTIQQIRRRVEQWEK